MGLDTSSDDNDDENSAVVLLQTGMNMKVYNGNTVTDVGEMGEGAMYEVQSWSYSTSALSDRRLRSHDVD